MEEVLKIMKYLEENLIAISAFLISLVTVISQHRHNKKSVRPYADAWIDDENPFIILTIYNKGIGPLIIEKIILEYKNLKVKNITELLRNTLELEDLEKIGWNILVNLEKRALLPSEGLEIFKLEIKDQELMGKVKKILNETTGELIYFSLYKEKFALREIILKKHI